MDKFEPAQRTILGWEVQDIKKVVAFLGQKGVVFERYPWMEQDAWFKDPDGNILSVAQH
jgi:hypothetical protein